MIVIIFRSVILYVLVIFALRMMGRRQVGELQPFELVVTILVSNIAAIPIENTSIPVLSSAVPILLFMCFEVILSSLTLKSKKFREFVSGHPIPIIRNGRIDQMKMKEIRLSVDDLVSELRAKDIFDLDEVEYAVVETTGEVNAFRKSDAAAAQFPQLVVIDDGLIDYNALTELELTDKFIIGELAKNNLSLKQVFIMTSDKAKTVRIIKRSAAL